MASIRPLRALRYDLPRAGRPADLMAPPYDVVDEAQRDAIAARSENNCFHFVLPEGEGEGRYAAGARRFRAIASRAMLQDPTPAIYVHHQRFEVRGRTYTRKGLVALVELTRFGEGPVLAHERTLAGPKADRLALMRACRAHLELVFGLFSDPRAEWEALVGEALGEPVWETVFDGAHHRLYRVDAPEVVAAVVAHLGPEPIYIADGHHRYETMCAYRDELRAEGHAEPDYGLMYLSNLDDPGLVVLPIHRVVHGLPALELPALLRAVEPWFSVEDEPLPGDAAELEARLGRAGSSGNAFGLASPGSGRLHVLTRRPSFDASAAGLGHLAPALARLDVVLLHELVLEQALGIDKPAQAAQRNLTYVKSTDAALQAASRPSAGAQLVCFMNATPVADVRAVCDSGQVMPQKSTFFHPKIPSGLVFYDLDAAGDRARVPR